jgi:hypothetical protein
MVINTSISIKMTPREINETLRRLQEEKWRLQQELEENEGEVTESVLTREQAIKDIKALILSPEGVDSLGRLIRSNKDDIETFKGEKKAVETKIKKTEGYNDWLLELVDECLKECECDKASGKLGYSFTQHTSVTTEVDKKMLKDMFYEKALEAIRATDIPQDVTITLSASVSLLPEGSERPEWYNTTTIGRATPRMPKKPKEPKKEEFTVSDF